MAETAHRVLKTKYHGRIENQRIPKPKNGYKYVWLSSIIMCVITRLMQWSVFNNIYFGFWSHDGKGSIRLTAFAFTEIYLENNKYWNKN